MIFKVRLLGAGLTIWPFIFIDERYTSTPEYTINHERIHIAQQLEMLFIFFWIWYGIEWLVNIPKYGRKAQKKISLEQEGYYNRRDLTYLSKRKPYAWVKYLNYKPVN